MLKHGHTRNELGRNRATLEYRSWRAMKNRCLNNSGDHKAYFGMAIHEPWITSFEAFLADMGPRPSADHTLDRIDGSRGYFPDNCRWATSKEQAHNRCSNVYPGTSVEDAAITAGIAPNTVRSRMGRGWSPEDALTPKGLIIRPGHDGVCVRGEKNANAKLTADNVRHILSSEDGSAELSRKYGVSKTAINQIRTRKTWRHVNV